MKVEIWSDIMCPFCSYSEWRAAHPVMTMPIIEGPTCTPDGECN